MQNLFAVRSNASRLTVLALISIIAAACSSTEKIADESPPVPQGSDILKSEPASATPAEATKLMPSSSDVTSTSDAASASEGMSVRLKPDSTSAMTPAAAIAEHPQPKLLPPHLYHGSTDPKGSAASHTHAHTHAPPPAGTEPDKALGWLKNGNTRFTKMRLRRDGQSPKDIKRLKAGQAPHSIVLSCSDSRVPPEIVFDQKLGELFTVRTAGESLSSTAIASMEYAVEHLGTRLLIVMGHTSCGAVKAAVSTVNGGDAGSPNLNDLVADIHPRIKELTDGGRPPSPNLEAESWANARGVARDLQSRSAILSQAVQSGRLKIAPALYHLDSGKVDFFGL